MIVGLSLLKSVIKHCYLNPLSLIFKDPRGGILLLWLCLFVVVCGTCSFMPDAILKELFICFAWQQAALNPVPCRVIYSTQLFALELISQFHCQLEAYSLVRRNRWSQVFSASTLPHWQLHSICWDAFYSSLDHWHFHDFFVIFVFANDLLIIIVLFFCLRSGS